MNTIRNFFTKFKIEITSIATEAVKLIVNFKETKGYYSFKIQLKECIVRTENAYYSLTGYHAPQLISLRQLEEIIMNSETYERLRINLESCYGTSDPLYVLLLSVAIANVYKPRNTPSITGFNMKYLK